MNQEPQPDSNDFVLTPLAELAGSTHEIFKAYVAAGFTEWQACRIIGTYLAELGRQS